MPSAHRACALKNIAPYDAGLELINGLRPISFAWKVGGRRDLGLGAEEVAQVEPLLVTHNDKGEIEGVKYAQLSVVLINAVKEQQAQLEQQQKQIRRQQQQIDGLKKPLCQIQPQAEICQ